MAPKVATQPKVTPKREDITSQGCDQYLPLLSQYEWDTRTAYAIMRAESGCNTQAIGDDYPIAGLHAPSCGLFQVRTLAGRPPCEALQVPERNVAIAYKLYKANGWQPWSVYLSGKYKQYL